MFQHLQPARLTTLADTEAAVNGHCDLATLITVVMDMCMLARARNHPGQIRAGALEIADEALCAYPEMDHPTLYILRREVASACAFLDRTSQ